MYVVGRIKLKMPEWFKEDHQPVDLNYFSLTSDYGVVFIGEDVVDRLSSFERDLGVMCGLGITGRIELKNLDEVSVVRYKLTKDGNIEKSIGKIKFTTTKVFPYKDVLKQSDETLMKTVMTDMLKEEKDV